MNSLPGVTGAAVVVVAIIGATVAVCIGAIDSGTFAGIVGAGLGLGGGAGAHAAGAAQSKVP